MLYFICAYLYRRKSQQAEREYEKVKHQLENLEESVRDRCKKEFTGTEGSVSMLMPKKDPFLSTVKLVKYFITLITFQRCE